MALSNTTGQSVSLEVSFTRETIQGQQLDNRTVLLGPRETQRFNVEPYLGTTSAQPTALGVSMTHTGAPGDVLVQGMLSDATGYSANMRFLERAALTGGKLFSPVLPLGEPVEPILMLHNTTANAVNIEVEAYYTMGEELEEAVLHTVSVAPGSVRFVNLSPELQTLPEGASNIGLTMSYYAHGGGLLADFLLIDASGSGVYQVSPKGYAMDQHSAHSFPFRIGGSMETVITVANPSEDEDTAFSLFVFHDGQSYTYKGRKRLKPGEVRHINIKALRDDQIPSLFGDQIPATVTSGQVKVMFHDEFRGAQSGGDNTAHQGHGAGASGGISGAAIYDTVDKISLTTCAPPPQTPACLLLDPGNAGGSGMAQADCSWEPASPTMLVGEVMAVGVYVGYEEGGADLIDQEMLDTYEAEFGPLTTTNDEAFSLGGGAPVFEVTAIGYASNSGVYAAVSQGGEVVLGAQLIIFMEGPYLHSYMDQVESCDAFYRGSEGWAELENSTGLHDINWSFSGGGGSISGENLSNTTWVGVIAVSGTITVSFKYPNDVQDTRSCGIVAINRTSWNSVAPNPTKVASTLTTPPTNQAHLAVFQHERNGGGGIASLTTIGSGPNKGFVYFAQSPVPIVQYMINAHLEAVNPTSEFFNRNCGNYGFISGSNLLTQTIRHEVGGTKSHLELYRAALLDAANNYGTYLENKTRAPGTDQEVIDWATAHDQELINRRNAIQTVSNNGEPRSDSPSNLPAVNFDADNNPLGNVNWGPNYQFCP